MIRLPFPATWLVPAATAAWAVWTWANEHSVQREKERLVLAQNHLADLLNYLEKKLGYSYFPATRKKCGPSMEAL